MAENENFLVPNKNDTTFLVKVKKKKPEGGGAGNKRWVRCHGGRCLETEEDDITKHLIVQVQDVRENCILNLDTVILLYTVDTA